MSSRTRGLIIAAVIVAIAVSIFLVLHRRSAKGNGDIKTATVERGTITVTVAATGTLNPLNSVQVGSQISGTIAELHADFNSRVHKGQLIALIDTTFLVASVRDAQSSVERATAEAKQAEIQLDRAKTLAEKNLVSKVDLEAAEVNRQSADAALKSAVAQLDRAKINLKYASIRAPVDGVVVARNVDVGQTVAASFSAPTLFVIANDLKQMQLEANIDEADIGMVKVGQHVTFTVNAYPDETFEGVVSQVRLEPVTVQDVVNYVIIVAVSNPDEKLMPGMTATLAVKVDERDNVLKIPNLALRFKPPETSAGKGSQVAVAGERGAQTASRGTQGGQAQARQQGGLAAGTSAAGGGRGGAGGASYGGTRGREGAASYGARTGAGAQGKTQGMRPGGAQGESTGAGTTGSRQGQLVSSTKVIWKVTKEGKLIPVTVRIGVTDGSFTEVDSSELAVGDAIAVGYTNPKLNENTQSRGGGGRMFFGH